MQGLMPCSSNSSRLSVWRLKLQKNSERKRIRLRTLSMARAQTVRREQQRCQRGKMYDTAGSFRQLRYYCGWLRAAFERDAKRQLQHRCPETGHQRSGKVTWPAGADLF